MGTKPAQIFKKPAEAKKQEDKDIEQNKSVQFTISDDMKKQICMDIRDMRDEARSARSTFMRMREEGIRQYEGIKQESSDPWPGHSNISTMVTTVSCDMLQSKIFPMAWNIQSISWEGREEHDPDTAKVNQNVMSWVITVDMALQNKVDDLVHLLIVDGTIAVKLIWKPYWRWITRKIPKITPNAIINKKLEYDVEYDYIRDERCELDIRPLERVYIPFHTDTSAPRWEDEAEYILDERWYTPSELRDMQIDGVIDDSVDIKTLLANASLEKAKENTGTSRERANAEGSAPSGSGDTRQESQKLCCYEAYVKYPIEAGKKRQQCVFLVVVEPYLIYLSGKALCKVSRIERRPWVIRPFLRRPGRAYGKSVPDLVRHLHNLLDARFNMLIDAGNKVIGGGGFYRPSSNINPRRIKSGPATWIPVDNPQQDVYIPQYNLSGLNWGETEIKFIMELIQNLTYMTPVVMGEETANRPTARGTLAVLQQATAKFGLIGSRVQAIICDILTDVRQKYEENMPPAKWERIMGADKLRDWPSPEYMAGMYDCKMQLDVTSLNTEAEMQIATLMYQSMAMDPLVMRNPAFMWEIRADYLRAHRREPVEKYIGPCPDTQTSKDDVEALFTQLESERQPKTDGLDPAVVIPELTKMQKTDRYAAFTPEAKFAFADFVRRLKMDYMEKVQQNIQLAAQNSPAGGASPYSNVQQPQFQPQQPPVAGAGQQPPLPAGAPQVPSTGGQ